MKADKYGKAVNDAVKNRLKEFGLEGNQNARWMAVRLAFDVINIMSTFQTDNSDSLERRADTRINGAMRAAFSATEGLNPKGPEYL